MILLIGVPTEPPLEMVKRALDRLQSDYVVFNQRHFADYHIQLEICNGEVDGDLYMGEKTIPLRSITGAYARPMDDTKLPELFYEPANSAKRNHCRSLHELIIRWLQVAPGHILNRPAAMASNSSKPFQLQIIKNSGFEIPATLITNDPAEAMDFYNQHKRIIYKSISGVRSIVTEFSDEDVRRLDRIRWCPTQFQERLEGYDVRVHVVDDVVFAARAKSTATDYRYSPRQGGVTELEPYCLPKEWQRCCVDLSKGLGMDFTGIDLKFTTDGRVCCFEVNPCPAYSYYEEHTGQPIAHTVASYLSSRH